MQQTKIVHIATLKVAFSQKGLMCSSFLQTDEPKYFPELEFWFFFHSKWLKSCQIRTCSCSEYFKKVASSKHRKQWIFIRLDLVKLHLCAASSSQSSLTWLSPTACNHARTEKVGVLLHVILWNIDRWTNWKSFQIRCMWLDIARKPRMAGWLAQPTTKTDRN